MYNLTNMTEAATFAGQISGLNELSSGMFGISLLASLAVIFFMVSKKYEKDFKESLVYSSGVTVIVSIPMYAFNLLTWKPVGFCIMLLVASLLVFKFTD